MYLEKELETRNTFLDRLKTQSMTRNMTYEDIRRIFLVNLTQNTNINEMAMK